MNRRWQARLALAAGALMVITASFLPTLPGDLVILGACSGGIIWASSMQPRPGARWMLVGQLVMFATNTVQDFAEQRYWLLAPSITIKHWVALPLALLVMLVGLVMTGRSSRISPGQLPVSDVSPSD